MPTCWVVIQKWKEAGDVHCHFSQTTGKQYLVSCVQSLAWCHALMILQCSNSLFKLHRCSAGVDQDCLKLDSVSEQWKCLYTPVNTCFCCHGSRLRLNQPCDPTKPLPLCHTQYTYTSINSPVFWLNSVYYTWQLDNSLQLVCIPPDCTRKQMEFQQFRTVSVGMLSNR